MMQNHTGHVNMDPTFQALRINMQDKICKWFERKYTNRSSEWKQRLPDIAKMLEESIFKESLNKDDYMSKFQSGIEGRIINMQNQLNQKRQQQLQQQQQSQLQQHSQQQNQHQTMAHHNIQSNSSSVSGMMIPTPGISHNPTGTMRMPSSMESNQGINPTSGPAGKWKFSLTHDTTDLLPFKIAHCKKKKDASGSTSAGPRETLAPKPTATQAQGKDPEIDTSTKRKLTSDPRDKSKDKKQKGPVAVPRKEKKIKKKGSTASEPIQPTSPQPILEGDTATTVLQSPTTSPKAKKTVSAPNPPGSPLVLGAGDSSSKFGEIILLGEEELARQANIAIPDNEKDVGVIWRGGFPSNDPDGFVAHVPKFSKMQKGEGSSSDKAKYACEIFRATATPAQRTSLANNPQGALDNLVTTLHDMGVIMGHFKDVYDKGASGVDFNQVNPATSKKALLERDFFHDQALGYKKKYEAVGVEVSSLRAQVAALEKLKEVDKLNIAAYKEKLKIAEERKTAKDAEIAAKDAVIAAKDAEIIQLNKDKTTGPEYLSKFLESRAFMRAASHACVHLMRYSMYEQLKELGKSFPFLPEHVGYASVPEEEAAVMALPGFSWDPERDMLLNAEGAPVVGEIRASYP